jgi:hypothetical protein
MIIIGIMALAFMVSRACCPSSKVVFGLQIIVTALVVGGSPQYSLPFLQLQTLL